MAKNGKKPTILIIDDDRDLARVVQLNLEREGYQVDIATDGLEGLQEAYRVQPDLVILDIMMPKMDGWEVCRRLRETSNVPILILSAKGTVTDIAEGLQTGADDYLTKPFSPNELTARVQTLLRRVGVQLQTDILLQKEIKRLHLQRIELLRRIETLEKESSKAGTIPISELGQLASGIVHDLRGGLGVIRNTAGFMLDDLDADDPLATDLHKIIHSAEFCEVITRNLMALGGGEVFEPTEVNIERVVREVFFMLERKLVDVTLVVDADPDTPTIMADEGQMKQVFMNLIKNAGEAMPDGGTLTVRTRPEGQMLRIEVSDMGCGISPENQERLFQEFFTTKDRGYGLGLHIVNTIVKRHGGNIEVESKIGEGTTFTLHLPIESE